MYSKFFVKLFIFLVLLLSINSVIYLLLIKNSNIVSEPDIQRFYSELNGKLNVVYFGDSVIRAVGLNETDGKTLADLVCINTKERILFIDHPAYHTEIFLEYSKQILSSKGKPNLVIIPINLRTFSVQLDSRPEYEFVKEKVALRYSQSWIGSFLKPALVFRLFNSLKISQETYENTSVYIQENRVGTVRDFKNLTIKQAFGFDYMYPLSYDHKKIKALVSIAKLYREANIKVVYYITPIDYQTGENNWGANFDEQVVKNIDIIKAVLSKEKQDVVDLSFLLGAEDFDWKRDNYPNEHLKETGRVKLASEISRLININEKTGY